MSIIYVTKDAERAAGIDLGRYPELYILTNRSPLADALHLSHQDRVLLNGGKPLSTLELCKQYSSTISKIDQNANILVFKTSRQIERICHEHNWHLLNPSAELAEKFERKLSQIDWFSTVKLNLKTPPTRIATLDTLRHEQLIQEFGNPFVIQFNLGHTGEGTKIITSPYDLEEEIIKSPQREVKISKFIRGRTYTINACVLPNEIRVGKIALQLTDKKSWSDNQFATVGNDFNAAKRLYVNPPIQKISQKNDFIPEVTTQEQTKKDIAQQIIETTQTLGRAMRLERWQGLYGVDFLLEDETNELFLLEVNARQQSGASFETQLSHQHGASGPLDWHLNAVLHTAEGYPNKYHEINGAQIFLRKNSGPVYDVLKHITKLGSYTPQLELKSKGPLFDVPIESKNMFIIPYAATDELYRVQSHQGYEEIMANLGF